jgi:hypothetical protein
MAINAGAPAYSQDTDIAVTAIIGKAVCGEHIVAAAQARMDSALASMVAPYPSGTIVKLKTGETCIVKRNHPDYLKRPQLRVYNERSSQERVIDLHENPEYKNVRITKTIDL